MFLPPGHALLAKFARLTRRRKNTACSTRRRQSARARGGNGGWRSEDSRCAGIGWYGGGETTKRMKRAKRRNHEIDETHEKRKTHQGQEDKRRASIDADGHLTGTLGAGGVERLLARENGQRSGGGERGETD